jgi:hypothetical protein
MTKAQSFVLANHHHAIAREGRENGSKCWHIWVAYGIFGAKLSSGRNQREAWKLAAEYLRGQS